eukprot:m.17968 g.17968  ORF g.17968 m.17968 type:complete len:161 (+) comp10724_c0_seq4:691-1173(+)
MDTSSLASFTRCTKPSVSYMCLITQRSSAAPSILLFIESGEKLACWGSGSPLRQFVFSEDLGRLMIWTLREYPEIDPIILSVDEAAEVSIRDVVYKVADAAGFAHDQVEFDTSKADGQFKKTASNAKLRKYLPDFKFTSMEDGIKQSVDWFFSNYETARK